MTDNLESRLFAGFVLEKFTEFRGPEGDEHRWCQRRHQPNLGDQQRTHRQPVEAVARGDGQQHRFAGRFADVLLAIRVCAASGLLQVINQRVDALFDGRWGGG